MSKEIFAPEQYLSGHQLKLVGSGEPFFEQLLRLIDGAKKLLHFQVYIFEEDDTGRLIAAALKRAAQRGVAVYLVLDSYGSKDISTAFINDLKAQGIQYKCFSPLPRYTYTVHLGRRLHHKVMVADNTEALIGGINIADKYRGKAGEAAWLDFAIRVQGPVCVDISSICTRIFREKYFGKLKSQELKAHPASFGKVLCRVALNDWIRRKNQISISYQRAIKNAQESITIVASYFLPGRRLRYVLKKAAQRGVKVNLLLPGKSDVQMAKRATQFLYQWVLRYNIQIYEWEDTILHGKLAIVDNKWVTIGSYNLNHLSQFSSIEMNMEVLDNGFAASVQAKLSALMQQSKPITADALVLQARGIIDRFLDWGSYTLSRWIMLILFFLIRREEKAISDEI